MSDTMLLVIAIGVFVMLVIGIALTIYEFRQAGEEPAENSHSKGDHPGR
ncbi:MULTISPECIES: hypothetical protein [Microbulbifer]|nr:MULTISPECIES: hypothetical protein [Microbulbifer]UHQ54060.1 hypothetical protein LVE68_11085 [Microbulbifer sp. YPW16]